MCVCVGERGSTIRSTFSWVPLNLNKWPHFKLSTRERERGVGEGGGGEGGEGGGGGRGEQR